MSAQQKTAMKAGNVARLSATAYRRRCTAGEITMETAIRDCKEAMTLLQLLRSFRRCGFTKAENLARDADLLTLDVRMGGREHGRKRLIFDAERQRLIDALHGNRTPRVRIAEAVAKRESDDELIARLLAAGCNVDQVAKFFSISRTNAANRIWQARMRKAA